MAGLGFTKSFGQSSVRTGLAVSDQRRAKKELILRYLTYSSGAAAQRRLDIVSDHLVLVIAILPNLPGICLS